MSYFLSGPFWGWAGLLSPVCTVGGILTASHYSVAILTKNLHFIYIYEFYAIKNQSLHIKLIAPSPFAKLDFECNLNKNTQVFFSNNFLFANFLFFTKISSKTITKMYLTFMWPMLYRFVKKIRNREICEYIPKSFDLWIYPRSALTLAYIRRPGQKDKLAY